MNLASPETFSELFELVEKFQDASDVSWFRGCRRASYPLSPSISRHPTKKTFDEIFPIEIELRNRFAERSPPFVTRALGDDWDKYFLMQHYGVPTRLLARLREATEVVLDVADLSLELIDHGILIFDEGARKVRGDSGAAISAAIAGVSSSIFVTNLNLRKFRAGEWARTTQARINSLRDAVTARQTAAFERVASLQAIALPEERLPLLELMSNQ